MKVDKGKRSLFLYKRGWGGSVHRENLVYGDEAFRWGSDRMPVRLRMRDDFRWDEESRSRGKLGLS